MVSYLRYQFLQAMCMPLTNTPEGIGKAQVVAAALDTGQKSNTLSGEKSYALHLQLVSHEGELKWFLDKDATSKMCRKGKFNEVYHKQWILEQKLSRPFYRRLKH